MNRVIAQDRINQVLMVDSINSTEADFLATHVPFKAVAVKDVGHISENELYSKYVSDEDNKDKHQFIIVEGSSGSGKSHFIRWIHARLAADENNKDVVLLIRRSDNTLKGTIKQLLEIDEVKGLGNKDAYERLVKANQTISEHKFKDEIYHKFIVEIKNDESEASISNSKKNNLCALLSNDLFEERMHLPGGPIDRIFHKVVTTEFGNSKDEVALFKEKDFLLDTDFGEQLQMGADKKATKMANSLIPDEFGNSQAETIAEYMNTLVDSVIQSCAGIEPGDFQQIFKEIRQELYKQRKNLILLIEDITSFTGINQELLNALVTEHTGLNKEEHMCRLLSIVGTTTEYYKQFRDNYKDRITAQVTIEDGIIGNKHEDIITFVAKYLNVASLLADDIENWYQGGAQPNNYPVHTPDEAVDWETFEVEGKKISIYPFTRNAIVNLYENMQGHKTPRYVLREIVEPAINEIIINKKEFPSFAKKKSSNLSDATLKKIGNIISNLDLSDDGKASLRERVVAFVGFWGNGSLDSIYEQNADIGGIPGIYFDEFGLEKFREKLQVAGGGTIHIPLRIDQPDPVPTVIKPTVNKKYDDFRQTALSWLNENTTFTGAREYRDAVCDFINNTIDWQREGIPLTAKATVDGTNKTLISFERQDFAEDKGLFRLPANNETFELLMCFGRWKLIGNESWAYEDAPSDIYTATGWLQKNKREIIEAVREENTKTPDYIKCAIVLSLYYRIFMGKLDVSSSKDIDATILYKKVPNVDVVNPGHSTEWEKAKKLFKGIPTGEEIDDFCIGFYNIVQGSTISKNKRIINYTDFAQALQELQKYDFDIPTSELAESTFKGRRDYIDKYKKLRDSLDKIIKSEIEKARQTDNEVHSYFAFDESAEIEASDIRELLDEVKDFYQDAEINGVNIPIRTDDVDSVKNNSVNIANAIKTIELDYDSLSIIDTAIIFSRNPIGVIQPLIDILKSVKKDIEKAETQLKSQKEALVKGGSWINTIDERFSKYEKEAKDFVNYWESRYEITRINDSLQNFDERSICE